MQSTYCFLQIMSKEIIFMIILIAIMVMIPFDNKTSQVLQYAAFASFPSCCF